MVEKLCINLTEILSRISPTTVERVEVTLFLAVILFFLGIVAAIGSFEEMGNILLFSVELVIFVLLNLFFLGIFLYANSLVSFLELMLLWLILAIICLRFFK